MQLQHQRRGTKHHRQPARTEREHDTGTGTARRRDAERTGRPGGIRDVLRTGVEEPGRQQTRPALKLPETCAVRHLWFIQCLPQHHDRRTVGTDKTTGAARPAEEPVQVRTYRAILRPHDRKTARHCTEQGSQDTEKTAGSA